MSDINKKSTPDQMRVLLKRMRVGNEGNWQTEATETPKKNLDVRDMLKITRRLHEEGEAKSANMKTVFDQKTEEQKMLDYFKDLRVNIKFIPLEITDNRVFWGGTIDGVIQFVFKVTSDESTSGVVFNYLKDFSPDNPDNNEIIERVKLYDEVFYKYWQNNMIQPESNKSEEKPIKKIAPWEQQQFNMAAE